MLQFKLGLHTVKIEEPVVFAEADGASVDLGMFAARGSGGPPFAMGSTSEQCT